MFEGQPTVIPSHASSSPQSPQSDSGPSQGRKIILLVLVIVVLLSLAAAGFWFWQKKQAARPQTPVNQPATSTVATNTNPILPDFSPDGTSTSTNASSSFADLAIEYLSFADFYKTTTSTLTLKLNDYTLPLDVKIDAINYYDLSRKLDLDPGLDGLNNNGFAVIDNPWPKEAPDFYALYSSLDQKQIPFLVTSDFIFYYYQNTLKKIYKDIEANIFYDNLWSINKEMYDAAKTRYEARLASLGNVNDSILEGERLEAAFFATALELLKPAANQLAPQGTVDDPARFTAAEVNKFYFSLPPYLREDVLREEKLIREGAQKTKSPVMLYAFDYSGFKVPVDYQSNAKLNNFYLTNRWLNSLFPLNYKDKNCPTCLLDYPDWRINFTAASFIAQDFSSLPDLKNKWARIYKVMAFFKGLREDLSYVQYRDALSGLFGADYKIDQIFDDQNAQVKDNLEKTRTKLTTYDFPPIQGALNRQDASLKGQIGFRMLAESYWPNDYIFSRLAYPTVTSYLATSTKGNNITACQINRVTERCNGFALDPINLVYPITGNSYFSENTNYKNYSSVATDLVGQLNQAAVWHTTNYWTSLDQFKAYLGGDRSSQPLFTRSPAWQGQELKTLAAAWTNLQLPWEKFSVNQLYKGQGLSNLSRWNENSYVDPNYNLLDELTADNNMLLKMFAALRIDQEVSTVVSDLTLAGNNLNMLKGIVVKELSSQALSTEDNANITDFVKGLTVIPAEAKDKKLSISLPTQKSWFKEDISKLKLMVLVHQDEGGKFLSVGPVWDYQETR